VRLLMDTVALILAVEAPQELSRRASAALENPANNLELSAISLTEIAIKSSRGKLKLSGHTMRQAVEDMGLRILPYTAEHAFGLFALPPHHADPFDRQIIAQALAEGIPVLTCDHAFALYKGLKVIW
jgi:PIN domain nuclease of toxin-antitoxin system